MTDFRRFDAGQAFLAGRAARDERILKTRLAGLASQAYGADPSQQDSIVQQAIALDPQAGYAIGNQAQQATQSREQRVGKLAVILSQAPEQMRGQLYRQMLPELQRIGLQAPPEYTPEVQQMVGQLASVYGGQAGAQTPSEIRTLQMLQANPDLLAINDRFRGQKSFKEVTNPDGSKSYVALDNRTGTGDVAPIGQPPGQPAPQAQPMRSASGSPNMDALAQAANAMIAAGIPSEQVDAILMQAAQGTRSVQVQPPGMVPAGGPPVAPQAAPAPSRGLPSIMDIGGGEPGFRPQGLGQTDRDRAGAAAQQAAMVEQARIAAQQAAAPRQAALDAERESAVVAARGSAENRAKRIAELPRVLAQSDQTISLIEQAINHPGRVTATGASSRFDPRNYAPGTDATNFNVLLDQLKGKTFLEAFQSLKGGGAITQVEGTKAEQAIARLDTAQSDEAFLEALLELQQIARDAKAKAVKMAQDGEPTPAAEQNDDEALIGKYL